MTDYVRQMDGIRNVQSLEDIRAITRTLTAEAAGEGGILYSGPVGKVRSEVIAKEMMAKTMGDNR